MSGDPGFCSPGVEKSKKQTDVLLVKGSGYMGMKWICGNFSGFWHGPFEEKEEQVGNSASFY